MMNLLNVSRRVSLILIGFGFGSLGLHASAFAEPARPAWLRPGTKVVYFEGQAQISNAVTKVTFDENGNMTVNGRVVGEEAIPGGAGGGFVVFEFGSVDPQNLTTVMNRYIFADANLQSVAPIEGVPSLGGAAPALVPSAYWRDPAELAQIQNGALSPGVFVLRMKYPFNNTQLDAIRIVTNTEAGSSAVTYDLNTGMAINSSFSGGSNGLLLNTNPNTGLQQTGTTVSISRLIAMQDVNLPWENMPVPAWVAQTNELTYNVDLHKFIPDAMDVHQPAVVTLKVTGRGPSWFTYDVFAQGQANGQQFGQPVGRMVASSGNHMSLFLPPQIINQLREGQVLDQDPTLKLQWVVSSVNQQSVVISEVGAAYRLDAIYDRNGVMVEQVLRRQDGVCTTTLRLTLAGRR